MSSTLRSSSYICNSKRLLYSYILSQRFISLPPFSLALIILQWSRYLLLIKVEILFFFEAAANNFNHCFSVCLFVCSFFSQRRVYGMNKGKMSYIPGGSKFGFSPIPGSYLIGHSWLNFHCSLIVPFVRQSILAYIIVPHFCSSLWSVLRGQKHYRLWKLDTVQHWVADLQNMK